MSRLPRERAWGLSGALALLDGVAPIALGDSVRAVGVERDTLERVAVRRREVLEPLDDGHLGSYGRGAVRRERGTPVAGVDLARAVGDGANTGEHAAVGQSDVADTGRLGLFGRGGALLTAAACEGERSRSAERNDGFGGTTHRGSSFYRVGLRLHY